MTSLNWKDYTADDGTQLTRHNHEAYIRGWCDWLDSWDNGFANFDNPYSRYYLTGAHNSWEAGRSDATNYLAGL
jgi:hypothetical protein